METNEVKTVKTSDMDLHYGCLFRFKMDNEDKLLQFMDVKEELHYHFYYKGNNVEALVFD